MLEVERFHKGPLWNSLSLGKQFKPRWVPESMYTKGVAVRGVVFAGSMSLLRAGTLLQRKGEKSCVVPSFLYYYTFS